MLKTKETQVSRGFWTHASVRKLESKNPVHTICSKAQTLSLEAMQAGWSGPPFDPAKLADILGVRVVPKEEVADARIVPLPEDEFQIEFNPNKPKARVRYSIAHELAHTLFPDCNEAVRLRASKGEQSGDEWQLEMLCNLAAAEFLMPIASFPELGREDLTIERVLDLRKQFDVSTEAVLLRSVRTTTSPLAIFTASRKELNSPRDRYCLDYCVGSRSWRLPLRSGSPLPKRTIVSDCTAIGFTAKGDESWTGAGPQLHVEAVGIPPFPGRRYPRIAGILRSPEVSADAAKITFVVGDALAPRGEGNKVIAHIVNDKTANWGAGFALALRRKWPSVQDSFREWALNTPGSLRLGNSYHSVVDSELTVFHMVCQHGYGFSPTPRLRYAALSTCLEKLAEFAIGASIHMPRIGAGEGGGAWGLIEQLIDQVLCAQGREVTVYDLPESNMPALRERQASLFS